jgi:predicted membrane chloride channel (bestrophin family)
MKWEDIFYHQAFLIVCILLAFAIVGTIEYEALTVGAR